MAIVTPDNTSTNINIHEATWDGMATGDTINSLDLRNKALAEGTIQLDGTWGGATVTAQVSNDGSTWFTLTDIYGANVSATDDAAFEYTTGANFMRFAISGGTGDSVTATITF